MRFSSVKISLLTNDERYETTACRHAHQHRHPAGRRPVIGAIAGSSSSSSSEPRRFRTSPDRRARATRPGARNRGCASSKPRRLNQPRRPALAAPAPRGPRRRPRATRRRRRKRFVRWALRPRAMKRRSPRAPVRFRATWTFISTSPRTKIRYSTSTASCSSSITASPIDAIRRRARARARVRRRPRAVRRSGARTGRPRLPAEAGGEPPRRHAAGAGRDHHERHEPPAFFGVERPFVDRFIPTTWFDAGAGARNGRRRVASIARM